MNTKNESRRYYPTAFALYVTYFVLGIAASIMGQYKQNFAALWGAETLADGSYNVSGVVAVIAAYRPRPSHSVPCCGSAVRQARQKAECPYRMRALRDIPFKRYIYYKHVCMLRARYHKRYGKFIP